MIEIISADLISRANMKSNIDALLYSLYDISSITLNEQGDYIYNYTPRKKNTENLLINDVIHIRCGFHLNPGATKDPKSTIGIIYPVSTKEWITQEMFHGKFKVLKNYAEKYYPGKYEMELNSYDNIPLIVQLSREECEVVRYECFINKLSDAGMNDLLVQSINRNVPFGHSVKETL